MEMTRKFQPRRQLARTSYLNSCGCAGRWGEYPPKRPIPSRALTLAGLYNRRIAAIFTRPHPRATAPPYGFYLALPSIVTISAAP